MLHEEVVGNEAVLAKLNLERQAPLEDRMDRGANCSNGPASAPWDRLSRVGLARERGACLRRVAHRHLEGCVAEVAAHAAAPPSNPGSSLRLRRSRARQGEGLQHRLYLQRQAGRARRKILRRLQGAARAELPVTALFRNQTPPRISLGRNALKCESRGRRRRARSRASPRRASGERRRCASTLLPSFPDSSR